MEASASVNGGEKVGLVGPNGSGKTTLFRLLVGEEQPDGGQVVVDRGIRTGYFSQDVGDMSGRSVLAETMAGAGEVSVVGAELHELEHKMADPAYGDEFEKIIERFGEVQVRFDELGGYGLEAKAREVLAGRGNLPSLRRAHAPTRRHHRPDSGCPLPSSPPGANRATRSSSAARPAVLQDPRRPTPTTNRDLHAARAVRGALNPETPQRHW